MVSRLDRLFILLDTGSNECIRLAAAKQLGEVQRVQPNDLDYLLRRIKEYSSRSVWETRVAAGHATKCVLDQIGPWPTATEFPGEVNKSTDTKLAQRREIAKTIIDQNVDIGHILNNFDLDKVVARYPILLSMTTTETEDPESICGSTSSRGSGKGRGRGRKSSSTQGRKNINEQLMRQRQLINKELGIAMVDSLNLGVKSTDIVSNDDLQAEYTADTSEQSSLASASSVQPNGARAALQGIINNYEKITELLCRSNCIESSEPDKTAKSLEAQNLFSGNRWPLTLIASEYVDDLFNASWEVRHGAAIALREIVRSQGKSAGKRAELSEASNAVMNQVWLIDMALKAICVLSLDKFGDFLFDQVVAPVRENAAQLLGCCVACLTETHASLLIKIILKMLNSPNWETRHGGMLGLKYSLSVLDDGFVRQMLKVCFEPIFRCLADANDDVSAEAAAALVPVKDLMIETIPDKAPKLIKFLWDHLADLDELTTSTSNIILLLASLLTSSSTQLEPAELIESIPRLCALLDHSSTTVRVSALKALITLIKPQKNSCLQWMPENLLIMMMRALFQRAILENMSEGRPYIEDLWMLLIKFDARAPISQMELLKLLKSTSMYLHYWLCLLMQPPNQALDRLCDLWYNFGSTSSSGAPVYIGSCTFNTETNDEQKGQATRCRLLGARLIGALFARSICEVGDSEQTKSTLAHIAELFIHYSKQSVALQRITSGWTLESWASFQIELLHGDYGKLQKILPPMLTVQLEESLQQTSPCYDELGNDLLKLQQEVREFDGALSTTGITTSHSKAHDKRAIYSLSQIEALCELNLEQELNRCVSKRPGQVKSSLDLSGQSRVLDALKSKKMNLTKSLNISRAAQKNLSRSVLSSLACSHIAWRLIPENPETIAKPLLDAIETESEQLLQDKCIVHLVTLIDIMGQDYDKHEGLIDNILNRLIDGLLSEQTTLDQSNEDQLRGYEESQGGVSAEDGNVSEQHKIVLLDNLQRKAELTRGAAARRQSTVNSSSSSLKRSHSLISAREVCDKESIHWSEAQQKAQEIKLHGARGALKRVTSHFGAKLPEKLPTFWASITSNLSVQIEKYCKTMKEPQGIEKDMVNSKTLVTNLALLHVVGESLTDNLKGELALLSSQLVKLLPSPDQTIRHYSSQCIGLICKLRFDETVALINGTIFPILQRDTDIPARCGAIEAIALIIEHLQLDLVPRINMFIVHVLRRMSDQNDQVRLMATHCFGRLLCLMPLNFEKNLQPMDAITGNDERNFIEQLLDPKKLSNHKVPFEMKSELRAYQQDGLNWLAFLNRFNLHGILCDEMGLGKTFMTICIVASDHFSASKQLNDEANNEKKANSRESSTSPLQPLPPSLIVCPTTLTEHWAYEIEKFIPATATTKSILRPLVFAGSATERTQLKIQISTSLSIKGEEAPFNLIITSYEILRNDVDFFKGIHWNYCVLDEGHIIKNGKTKLSKAVRLLNAKHRLILSGTPIQNNVTELWSLFDFLMPGFLGSERQFNMRYTKPILQSREPKCSPRELEAGALAMESLHRQVLPFVLRRLKEDVLDDLPPKIIQDYHCELSPLQAKLYEDFRRSNLCKEVTKKSLRMLDNQEDDEAPSEKKAVDPSQSSPKSHVFQALQYLKNVCNHPKLVLTEKHSQFEEIKKLLQSDNSSLDDIQHSSKLRALKQLLIDCGIGVASNQVGDSGEQQQQQQQHMQQQHSLGVVESVVNQHRALVFCQLRSMVNIIEQDLIKKHLPGVTYLKLDGSVPAKQRQSIVSRFNNDPSIDILLLTTAIGGLGLNLTGADTVIFVEHDWNPTKDLQAMDRAHRIGQKKVVNVYRLITKDTLEERIMGLQKFKTMVSNTVINQDNSGLSTMNVDQLLDLFDNSQGAGIDGGDEKSLNKSKTVASAPKSGGQKGNKSSFIDLLPELWDQQQYETEYDLSNFVSSLKN